LFTDERAYRNRGNLRETQAIIPTHVHLKTFRSVEICVFQEIKAKILP